MTSSAPDLIRSLQVFFIFGADKSRLVVTPGRTLNHSADTNTRLPSPHTPTHGYTDCARSPSSTRVWRLEPPALQIKKNSWRNQTRSGGGEHGKTHQHKEQWRGEEKVEGGEKCNLNISARSTNQKKKKKSRSFLHSLQHDY